MPMITEATRIVIPTGPVKAKGGIAKAKENLEMLIVPVVTIGKIMFFFLISFLVLVICTGNIAYTF